MKDFGIVVIFLALLSGSYYAAYRMGKWQERRDYTGAFIKATEATYWDGYNDGQVMGRKQGADIGYKKCLDEDFQLRDKY